MDKERICSFLAEKQCEFVFNAPSASHTGGVWERQIRTVRSILNAIILLCPGRLDDSSLRTVFYEAMSIVNCRQLTISEIDNPDSLEPLTPNHILTGKTSSPLPPPGEFLKEDMYIRKRWRRGTETRILGPDYLATEVARSTLEHQGRRHCSGEGRRFAAQPMASW